MEFLEFGDKSKRKIILIHGFQCPYQVWDKYIEHYKNDFHIIVPILPGHNPNLNEDFISFSDTAKELEDYLISRYGKNVYAVYGMSMGGVLTATLWQNRILNIAKVIFDGSPLVSVNSLVKNIMLRFYLNVTHKSQQRDKKTLEQSKNICPEEHLEFFLQVLDNMSDTSITNSISSVASYKLPTNLDAIHTGIFYFHGTAPNEMLAKKTAKYISKYYSNATIICFKGKAHCENSLFHPEVMIKELDNLLI